MKREEIIKQINDYLSNSGKTYMSEFYVGVTSDIDQRLFIAHNVQRHTYKYCYALADSEEIARGIEKTYLDHGMCGDTGGGTGDGNVRWVYCYELTEYTSPGLNDY